MLWKLFFVIKKIYKEYKMKCYKKYFAYALFR